MSKINKSSVLLLIPVVTFSFLTFSNQRVWAEATTLDGQGQIGFSGEYPDHIIDPENPEVIVDPGESPQIKGDLRLDFVPKFDFYQNKISNTDETYFSNAQNFFGETKPRGNFMQVSDFRPNSTGWTLQLRQDTQFINKNTEHSEIYGAMLSLDKSWVNSTNSSSEAPQLSKEIIKIENIGDSYNLAQASPGNGRGTWSISFGASEDNTNDQKSTLSPRLDKVGQSVLDPVFENKPVYLNKAVSLFIPGATIVDPVPYTTVLTWILAELP